MSDTSNIQTSHPSALSHDELRRFKELVIEGGEVAGNALSTNIANAKIIVLVRWKGIIRGVGALKRPQRSYREKVEKKAKLELLESNYPYELGYIYFEEGLRGQGLSHRLVALALEQGHCAGVFATVRTDNAIMRAVLETAGFTPAGDFYPGSKPGTEIGVLLRPQAAKWAESNFSGGK
ncbi:MAG TPA: GNAT family protein [Novosphingobium sp.]